MREGEHVGKTDGFVAIRDANPKAETHLLVLPERHVDTFRDVAAFPPHEAKRMLDFVAETARDAGLSDYRVVVNVWWYPYANTAAYGHAITASDPCLMTPTITFAM